MPSDRLIVLATLPPEQLKPLLTSDGSQSALQGAVQEMSRRVQSGHLWFAIEVPQQAGPPPAVAGMKVPQPRAVGVALNVESTTVTGSLQFQCANEQDAKQFQT